MSCSNFDSKPSIVSFEDFINQQNNLESADVCILKNISIPEKKSSTLKKFSNRKSNTHLSTDVIKLEEKGKSKIMRINSKKRKLSQLDEEVTITSVIPPKCDVKDDFCIMVDVDKKEKQEKQSDKIMDVQWSEAHCPISSSDLLVEKSKILKLVTWLKAWKAQIEREHQQLLEEAENNKKNRNKYDDDSDFFLTKDDLREADESLSRVYVIAGAQTCCKTSIVHVCAREVGFKVIELNASSERSSKAMLEQLREATQSQLVSKKNHQNPVSNPPKNSLKSFFVSPQNDGKCCKKTPEANHGNPPPTRLDATLILLDEAEAVLDPDKNFKSAVNYLTTVTKRPIVLTTRSDSALGFMEGKSEMLVLQLPSRIRSSRCLHRVARKEQLELSTGLSAALFDSCDCDVRQAIHTMQFWKEDLLRTKFPQEFHERIPSIHATVWGLINVPLLPSVDQVVEGYNHLRYHHLHPVCSPLDHCESHSENTPLLISSHPGETASTGRWVEDESDGELLSLAYHRREIMQPISSRHSHKPNLTPSPTSTPSSDGATNWENVLKKSESLSLADQLEGDWSRLFVNESRHHSPLLLDGDRDEEGQGVDPLHHSMALFNNLIACILAYSLDKESSLSSFESPLRSISYPTELYGGVLEEFTTTTSSAADLHMDVLPALRSMCRAEEKRRESKITRRFLHYLNAMGSNLSPADSFVLSTEYNFST